MYSHWWTIAGVVLVCLVVADAIWTTLTVRGAGPLSTLVAGAAGRTTMRGPGWIAENAPLLALLATFAVWSLLLWGGWTAIFCGSSTAVLISQTSAPTDLVGRAYFSGFTLTTLGIGDLVPGKGGWRVATVVAAANGFAVLTLLVTYTFSVVSALNLRRSLGAAVGHLGMSPVAIALLLREGGSQALTTRLVNLTDQLETASRQADAYPVLEYSHTDDKKRSFALAVVALGELSLLMELGLRSDNSLPPAVWKPLRQAVDLLIDEKRGALRRSDAATPSPPDVKPLTEAGLAVAADVESAFRSNEVQEQRLRWAKWLRWHGRDLEEIAYRSDE